MNLVKKVVDSLLLILKQNFQVIAIKQAEYTKNMARKSPVMQLTSAKKKRKVLYLYYTLEDIFLN